MPWESKDTVITVLMVISLAGNGYQYFVVNARANELAAKQTNIAEQAYTLQKNAQDQLAGARTEAAEKQRQVDAIRGLWVAARNQFASEVSNAIQDGAKPPGQWEPRNRPPNAYLARQIVDARNTLRAKITAMQADLQAVYNTLNSDVDELEKLLKNPPPEDPKARQQWSLAVERIFQRLAAEWQTHLDLIDSNVGNVLTALNCPKPS